MKEQKIKDISILIVEDELELQAELAEFIGLFFNSVYRASNTADGYRVYKNKKPDIVLSDVNMPDGSGLELIAKIRAKDMQTKIVVLSAHSDKEKLLDAIKLHLEAYLVKPLNFEELKSMLFKLSDEIQHNITKIYATEHTYWNTKTKTLWHKDKEVELKNRERLFFELLFSRPNGIFSANEIFEYIHREKKDKEFSSYSITSLVKRIRGALPEDIIQNIYGAGYKIAIN